MCQFYHFLLSLVPFYLYEIFDFLIQLSRSEDIFWEWMKVYDYHLESEHMAQQWNLKAEGSSGESLGVLVSP